MLAVLIKSGGTNGLQFTAGQHWLQNRSRVNGSLGSTRTNQGVDLIDEQDDVSAGADFLKHLLHALFEVTAVAGASHHRTEVQGVQVLVLQSLRNVAANNVLRQTFNNCGLTNTGLTDQHRVVLGAAGQHLHYPLNFLVPANYWIKFAVPGSLGEVTAILVQNCRTSWSALCGATGSNGFLTLVSR